MTTPRRSPGLLARTRRLRLACLGLALAASLAVAAADRAGLLALVGAPPFRGVLRLEAGGGAAVVVETVDLLDPPARLVVAHVPRRVGLRLRAALLSPEAQDLRLVGEAGAAASALVAVNGDYHRLGGFCHATPYSTLVCDGEALVVGSPFSYATALFVDRDGVPHVDRLDLGAELVLPAGERVPCFLNLETGDTLLVDRPPPGSWDPGPDRVGLPLERLAPGRYRVRAPLAPGGAPLLGPALLVRPDAPARSALERLAPGAELRLELVGPHAGRVLLALGTGPRLVRAGAPCPELLGPDAPDGWTNRLARTAAGLREDELLLATTVQAPRGGLSLHELARALVRLGCTDAVNLDGGPSSTLWAAPAGVVNQPPGVEDPGDPVASALLVLRPDGTPGLR